MTYLTDAQFAKLAFDIVLPEDELHIDAFEKQFEDTAIIAFDSSDDQRLLDMQQEFPGEKVESLHITLVFLGYTSDLDRVDVGAKIGIFAKQHAPIVGMFNGMGVFEKGEDGYPLVLLYDSSGLPGFRQALRDLFPDIEQNHGFTAHMTMSYSDESVLVENDNIGIDKTFDSIHLYWGDEHIEYPLTGDMVYKQLPIDEESKLNLIRIRQEIFNNDVNRLAERMFIGDITLGQWEESMKRYIREFHTSVAAIEKGGWDLMTFADWGRVGHVLRDQYGYLHNFAQYIADNRDTVSLAYIQARAQLYGNSAGYTGNVVLAGDVLSKKLPWLPKDGSTKCLMNCKCSWIFEVTNEGGEWKTVQATWKLHPAEHCDTCVERNGHVETFQVHRTVEVPDYIGYGP